MSEYQRIVEGIHSALTSRAKVRTAELEELASAYATACREINDRLLRCQDYLKRGLRSEAIDLAESPPNVLEMVGSLEMSPAAEWQQFCTRLGLPQPQVLMLSAARELSDAYGPYRAMESLLSDYRLLALMRRSVRLRLEKARELARRDPANIAWDEEIRSLEAHRLREMKAEAIRAVRARDFQRIEKLNKELAEGWRITPDDDLAVNLRKADDVFRNEHAILELRELLPQILAAYGAMAYGECRELVERWRRIVRGSSIEVPDDLLTEMRPVNRWIEEQELRQRQRMEFKAGCTHLAHLIEAGRPASELSAEHAMLAQMEEPVPDELERRYRQRLGELQTEMAAQRRQNRVFLLMVLSAGLVTIAVMVLGVVKLAGH